MYSAKCLERYIESFMKQRDCNLRREKLALYEFDELLSNGISALSWLIRRFSLRKLTRLLNIVDSNLKEKGLASKADEEKLCNPVAPTIS